MTARDRHLPVRHGQGYTKLCKLCRERIWMVPKSRSEPRPGWMALNLEPADDGNVAIDAYGAARIAGPVDDGEDRFEAHQRTCPPYLEKQRQAAQDAAQLRLGDDE